ncbi:MAG: arginase [Acidiferrobacterales bacterium]
MAWQRPWAKAPDSEHQIGEANDTCVTTPTRIIGAAIGAGAHDTRCQHGPDRLCQAGIIDRLEELSPAITWERFLRPDMAIEDSDAPAQIVAFCERLAAVVGPIVAQDQRVWVLGGDHSCAIGTWSGASAGLDGPLGLIWVDAHMDSHTPATSLSGAVHGMPLACLLGYGPPSLVELAGPGPKLRPENVCLVGVRSFEPEEAHLLDELGVRIFDMDEIARRGLNVVMGEALDLCQRNTAGFGLTLDLDAINPVDAPGVGSPESGGICGKDLAKSVEQIGDHPNLVGVEIAEFNPDRDIERKTAALVYRLLAAMVGR